MGRRFPAPLMEERVTHRDDESELDRRHFLKGMAWAGTGAVWTISSGVLTGSPLETEMATAGAHDIDSTRGARTSISARSIQG